MALVLEDGSGVTGANTYVSVSYVDSYCELMNYTSWTGAADTPTETQNKESAIYRSMQFFETLTYMGTKTAYTNPLSFPRDGIYMETGDLFPNDEIPEDLKRAVSEGAYLEYSNSGSLFTTGGDVRRVKRKKIDVLETEYFSSRNTVTYPKLKNMIKDFTLSGIKAVIG